MLNYCKIVFIQKKKKKRKTVLGYSQTCAYFEYGTKPWVINKKYIIIIIIIIIT